MARGRVRALLSHRAVRGTAFSGVNQVLPQLVGIATIPFILGALGKTGYGVWALVNVVIVVLSTLDGGISASAQRFYALYAVLKDDRPAARLTVSLLSAIAALGAVLLLLGPLLADLILFIATVPAALVPDARFLFSRIGLLVTLLLVANLFMGYLRAQHKFGLVAVATTLSQGVLVAGLIRFRQDLDLTTMFGISVAQLGTLALSLAVCSWPLVRTLRPRWAERAQLREFWTYSNRSLIMNVSSLAILQAGPLFVAAFASIEEVGYLSVAAMLASAVRSLPLFVIAPALTSLTQTFGRDGQGTAARLAGRLNQAWVSGTVGYTLVAMGAMWFVVRGWTGDVPTIGQTAILLTLANGFNLTTALSSAACRAFGRPGLEARYGIALTAGILTLSGPAAALGGALVVAAAIVLVQGLALLYFNRLLRRHLPDVGLGWSQPTWLVSAVVAAVLASLVGALSLFFPPKAAPTLAIALGGAGLGALLYVGANRRRLLGALTRGSEEPSLDVRSMT